MRLYSTRESSNAGEPSILSIVETLICCTGSISAGIYFGSWWHLFASSAIAPLMLLRTNNAARDAQRLMRQVDDYLDNLLDVRTRNTNSAVADLLFSIRAAPLVVFYYGIVTACIRALAFMKSVMSRPADCVAHFPRNWWKTVFSTDLAISPSLLPSTESDEEEPDDRGDVYLLLPGTVKSQHPNEELEFFGGRRLLIFLAAFFAVPLSFGLRISVKSTAFIWYPLIWAMKPAKSVDRSWEKQLQVERDLGKPRIVLVWSSFCLILLAVKYALWAARHTAAIQVSDFQALLVRWHLDFAPGVTEWLIAFVRPGAVPLWQVATLFNSVLGLFFCFRVRKWLAEFKHQVGPSDETIEQTIRVTFFFRRLLTLYVVVCNLWLIWQIAKKLRIPEIGPKLFPWL